MRVVTNRINKDRTGFVRIWNVPEFMAEHLGSDDEALLRRLYREFIIRKTGDICHISPTPVASSIWYLVEFEAQKPTITRRGGYIKVRQEFVKVEVES